MKELIPAKRAGDLWASTLIKALLDKAGVRMEKVSVFCCLRVVFHLHRTGLDH